MDPGVTLAEQGGRVVAAGGIDYDGFDGERASLAPSVPLSTRSEGQALRRETSHRGGGDAIQAFGEDIAHVPRDDDDRKIGLGLVGQSWLVLAFWFNAQ